MMPYLSSPLLRSVADRCARQKENIIEAEPKISLQYSVLESTLWDRGAHTDFAGRNKGRYSPRVVYTYNDDGCRFVKT